MDSPVEEFIELNPFSAGEILAKNIDREISGTDTASLRLECPHHCITPSCEVVSFCLEQGHERERVLN